MTTRRKERRYQTYPSRWGSGKVHRYVYDALNHVWHVACSSPGNDPHGAIVDSSTPITCKRCLR